MPRRSRKLNAHNTAKLRVRAPDVVEAMLYLDRLQARGLRTVVRISAGHHEVFGESVLLAIQKLRNKVGE